MAGYQDATYGNLSRMGLYASLMLPPLMLVALNRTVSGWLRIIATVVIAIGLANLVISGSRSGISVFLLALFVLMFRVNARASVLFYGAAGLLGAVTLTSWLSTLVRVEFVDRFIPNFGERGFDNSISERIASIQFGWDIFKSHILFGVGPDNSPEFNPYSIPHQSIVHQLSELGIVGGVAFLTLNLVVFRLMLLALRNYSSEFRDFWRVVCLVGPTSWLLFGLVGGIAFNSSIALVWIGIVHAMLALYGAKIVGVGGEVQDMMRARLQRARAGQRRLIAAPRH